MVQFMVNETSHVGGEGLEILGLKGSYGLNKSELSTLISNQVTLEPPLEPHHRLLFDYLLFERRNLTQQWEVVMD